MKFIRIIMIILSIALILMGLLLSLVSTTGFFGAALGVVLLIYFIRFNPDKIKEKSKAEEADHKIPEITAAYIDTEPDKVEPPKGIPSAKPRKQVTTSVAGVTFNCSLDRDESRQEILEDIYEGDPVEIREYEYQGSPAYYVIDPQTGLDIGSLPSSVAQKISQFDDPKFEAYVTRRGSFESDDRGSIEFCEVRVYVI